MVAIKFDSNKFDRKQSRMLSKSKKSLDKLYETFYKEVARIGATTGFDDPERDFFLKDYPKADKAMQALLRKLCDRITGLIEDGCQKGWSISNAKNSALINALGNIVPDRKDFINRINMRSESALNSFQDRKVNGLGLSERVWKSQQQVKGQIELALELGLAEGKSAPSLSRDVRSYLREPERLFRRVRDKKGHLRLSKSAAAYHPGQGVYRSSYKNALRMTVTENNIAYRTADFVQQQEMDFVIGIEIRLSDNHPCDDICDDLAGVYPKKFKFTGWHPFCRCYTIPKLAEREELNKWARMSREERAGYHFKGEVRSMPKKFTDWVDRNAERIKSAKSLPYFIKDNFKNGDPAKGLRWEGKTPDHDTKPAKTKHEIIMENAAKRHAARTKEQAKDIQDAWTERRLDFYDEQCDKLMNEIMKEGKKSYPALAKRQADLRTTIGQNAPIKMVNALFDKFKQAVNVQKSWNNRKNTYRKSSYAQKYEKNAKKWSEKELYKLKATENRTIDGKNYKCNVYCTPGGTEIIVPQNLPSNYHLDFKEIARVLESLPTELKAQADKIQLINEYYSSDAYFQKIYKNFKHGYAYGGNGTITFCKSNISKSFAHNNLPKTLAHENGHSIDHRVGKELYGMDISKTKEWQDAQKADEKVSKKKSPTNYGENAPTEDFAESCHYLIEHRKQFERDFPNRFKILKRILGI